MANDRFFLFIGANWGKESATDRLKASGMAYQWKRLDSRPTNWRSIIALLEDPLLLGVIAQLNSHVYDLIVSPDYSEVARPLLAALGDAAHIVFVHEAILRREAQSLPDPSEYDPDSSEYYEAAARSSMFDAPDGEVLDAVERLFEEFGVIVTPYRTNAEASVLASAFIEDNEKNLLFRIYIPAGRLYAAEADKLLSLFQDWLNRTGRRQVTLDGYRTASGEVYEFFGDEALARDQLSDEFNIFSDFLNLCVDDAREATNTLTRAGIEHPVALEMVSRYGKEVRRLNLDVRQQRELRMLVIRHQLESEIVEADIMASSDQIGELIQDMVPKPVGAAMMPLLELRSASAAVPITVQINQQIVHAVESAVIQNIQGTVNLGLEARDLLDLVARYAEADSQSLESDVYELEDTDARTSDRLGARQRLKGFLFQLGGKVEDTALAVLQNYVQSKIGI